MLPEGKGEDTVEGGIGGKFGIEAAGGYEFEGTVGFGGGY